MNYLFDEKAQKLIIMAKKEMLKLKHPYVGSEHLLLAILASDLDINEILNTYGVTYDLFKRELIRVVGTGSKTNNWFLFTPLLKRVINNSIYYAKDKKIVTPYSLLISLLQEGDGIANRILISMNIDIEALYEKIINSDYLIISNQKLLLDDYAINMNNSNYDPVIGRDKEINRVIEVLLRKNKNNPLLIGDAGVGKTAIVEELARRISMGDIPRGLKDKIIYNLSMSVLISGTKYRGEFEERVNKIINEVKTNPNIILFIDEIHTLVGAGGAEGAIDASNIVKPYLARGELKVIGATTIDEYNKYIAKDKALDRRFQKISINEATKEEVKDILLKLRNIYEDFHHVIIPDKSLNLIYELSNEYLLYGRQPDKTIDFLDEVCSYSSINNKQELKLRDIEIEINKLETNKNQEIINHNFKQANIYKNEEMKLRSKYNSLLLKNNTSIEVLEKDIYQVLYNKTNIPLDFILRKKLINLKRYLKERVYGQDKSIKEILKILSNYQNKRNHKPLVMLLVGKSGVGKTFLVEEIAKNICNSSFIKIDMNEYKDSNSLTKLLGSNPGYVGYDDGNSLSNKIKPFSIILLDNIEKANSNILKIFSEVFDSGYLTNSKNEKIDLSKCIIFITSKITNNLGFVDNSKSLKLSNINHIIYLEDINKNSIIKYLKTKTNSSDEIINKILEELDYSNNGFKKINDLIDKYSLTLV